MRSRLFTLVVGVSLLYVALCFFGLTFRSHDYRNGIYHPIPRLRYFLTSLAVGAGGIGVLLYRKSLRPRVLPPGICAACGYDLRATPERCPECGAVPRAGMPR